jgi:oligosaccharide reducing-end xylanase
MGKKVINSAALLMSSALIFSSSAAVDAPFEIGTWGNFCKGAISHTFDDYPTSSTDQQVASGQAAFDEKGFHMTLFVLPSSCNNNHWNSLKAAFAKGHEIASHNNQHNSEASGLKPSQNAIKSNVPGEMCVSIAYPNCNTPGDGQVLQTYIAGRNCNGQVNPKTPQNFAQIGSKMFGSGGCNCPNSANDLNSFADQAANSNGWAVACHHGIGSDGHSWAVTNLNAMKEHLNYLDQNRNKIWCETFGNVARYIKERDAASLTVESSEQNSIKIKLTDNLPDSIYNYPLSIRCPLPEGWTTVMINQNRKEVDYTISKVNSKDYLMFNAVPDDGDIIIQSGTRVRNLASVSASVKPVLLNKSGLSIDATKFSGSTIAISLYDLRGKRFASYSLNRSSSRITIPFNALTSSAFVVKATDGNTTVVTRCLAQ